MSHPPADNREVVNEITINAPIGAVWKAITEADELVRWFPLECKVTPGAGGSIWFSWKSMSIGEAQIEIWEPQQRLRTYWEMPSPDGSGAMARVSDEYTLSARGSATTLRLASSGFGSHSSWDGMYDSIRRGWNFELRGLQHYLERHRGKDRAVAWIQQKAAIPFDRVLDRLMGADGFNSQPSWRTLRAGARWAATNVDGSPLTGEALHVDPTGLIVIRLEQWNGALLRIEKESCSPGEHGGLWLWFSIYEASPDVAADLERRWSERCARLLR